MTSGGLSLKARCIMGDCVCCVLHHPQFPPLLMQTQSSWWEWYLQLIPGQSYNMWGEERRRVSSLSCWCGQQSRVFTAFFFCIFWYIINSLHICYILQYTPIKRSFLARPWADPWPVLCRWDSLHSYESAELNLLPPNSLLWARFHRLQIGNAMVPLLKPETDN